MRLYLTLFLLSTTMISYGQKLTTIKVSVPNKTDEVFIVGNQESLGNWQPNQVSMNKISDYQREISLNLTFPAEFKLTRGSWESEAKVIDYEYGSNLRLTEPGKTSTFHIVSWKDEKVESDRLILNYDIKYVPSTYYPDEDRVLKVYLPDDYDASKKYPVVYTLDGENLFELLMKNMSVLQDKTDDDNNVIPSCITVGIVNNDRSRDLFPNTGLDPSTPQGSYNHTTGIFYQILNEEIVTFIDKNYATSGYNAIIGHSDAGHFVTQLYLKQDHQFDAVIALSVNDFGDYFQNNLPIKLKEDNTKNYFLAYGAKDLEFNLLGDFMSRQHFNLENFKVKSYDAHHMQLPYASLFDGLQFIFSEYQYYDDLIEEMYNDTFEYDRFEKEYVDNIFEQYGIKTEIGYDIDYLLDKAIKKNNSHVFNSLLDEIDESNIYQLQIRFYYANQFDQDERAKSYLYEMLKSEDKNDQLIFYAYLENQYYDFFVNKLNQATTFISFVEEAKKKWPEYELQFNYIILKTLADKNISSSKQKTYYEYCEQNFKKNRYFTRDDLKKIYQK